MGGHDPGLFASSLSSKIASHSRHVCLFLGAGVSRACGLPDLSGLKDGVLKKLDLEDRQLFESELGDLNLEEALSRLRRISSLLLDGQSLGGLTAENAAKLDREICQRIRGELSLDKAKLKPMERFALWARRCSYARPLEIFTVNYDLLIEAALESKRTPYFDGFVGTLRAPFYTYLVEHEGRETDVARRAEERLPSTFVRLWKLHGSVNWVQEEGKRAIHKVSVQEESIAAAIYPSDEKYTDSRRVPFVVLQDRFRRALLEPETMLLIAGYSFGDEHLNELIFEAARRRPRSGVVAFCYGSIPDKLAEAAEELPNIEAAADKEAILGGRSDEWEVPEGDESVNELCWDTEDKRFLLGDFKHLSQYLAKPHEEEIDERE